MILACVFLLGGPDGSGAVETYPDVEVLVFYTAAPRPLSKVLSLRVEEAFRRIGKKSRVKVVESAQRALVMANDFGDGDAMRVAGIKEIAPAVTENLLAVPESVIEINFSVYTKIKGITLTGWDSLQNYHNGFRLGAKILEKNMPEKRTILPNAKRLFLMLQQDRLDTVVEHQAIGDHLVQNLRLKEIEKISPPLVSLPGFIMINKKHKDIIPNLAEALQAMKADGTFAKNWDDALTYYDAE